MDREYGAGKERIYPVRRLKEGEKMVSVSRVISQSITGKIVIRLMARD